LFVAAVIDLRGVMLAVPDTGIPTDETECAVEATVALIAGKWKPILLFHLASGPKRYAELRRLMPRASERMLSRALRELDGDGLIGRSVECTVPLRVRYTMTVDGQSLVPVLNAMSAWASAHAARRRHDAIPAR
jgi:DNA-binding HxlR family transcriptional regulator